MSETTVGFKRTLPTEIYRQLCVALYACKYHYAGNDLTHLSQLLKRWFVSAENHRVTINGAVYGLSFFSKKGNYCLMATGLTGNPTLYDLDANEINDYFNTQVKET